MAESALSKQVCRPANTDWKSCNMSDVADGGRIDSRNAGCLNISLLYSILCFPELSQIFCMFFMYVQKVCASISLQISWNNSHQIDYMWMPALSKYMTFLYAMIILLVEIYEHVWRLVPDFLVSLSSITALYVCEDDQTNYLLHNLPNNGWILTIWVGHIRPIWGFLSTGFSVLHPHQ